jgi:hypothetical protein
MLLKQILFGPLIATAFILSASLYKIAKEEINTHFQFKLEKKYIQLIIVLLGIISGISSQYELIGPLLIIYALGILLPALFNYKNKIVIEASTYFIIFLITYEVVYLIISSIV